MTLSLETLHERVAGIDVHRMKHVITALIEDDAGNLSKETREFGGFKRDLKALAGWLHGLRVELVILESTGIYWKSVYAVSVRSPPFFSNICAPGEMSGLTEGVRR